MDGRLALVSPYDPAAGFNVGHAMGRNKLIYALADAALVVSSDYQKGGTWTGAVEQLKRLKHSDASGAPVEPGLKPAPAYVREGADAGLQALIHEEGALPWPDPQTPEEFWQVFEDGIGTFGTRVPPVPAPHRPRRRTHGVRRDGDSKRPCSTSPLDRLAPGKAQTVPYAGGRGGEAGVSEDHGGWMALGIAGRGWVGRWPAAWRSLGRRQQSTLVNWSLTRRLALRLADAQGEPEASPELTAVYTDLVARSYAAVGDYTQAPMPPTMDSVRVLRRGDWIGANLSNFRRILRPVIEAYDQAQAGGGVGSHVLAVTTQAGVSAQLGVLLGFLGRRVLGQYDIPLLDPEPGPAAIYFVDSNLRAVAAARAFRSTTCGCG